MRRWDSRSSPSVCLDLFPELVIKGVGFFAGVLYDFTVGESGEIREQSFILFQLLIQQLIGTFVGSGIGNVLKIFLCDIGAAQKVNPFFCIFFVLFIGGNDPGVNPVVGSVLRNYILQSKISFLLPPNGPICGMNVWREKFSCRTASATPLP